MKTFQIQEAIDEVLIDYILTINNQGKIVSVKPLIYDLPESAQKLILGQKQGVLDRKIQGFSRLIPYIISLLLDNRLLAFKNNFEEVVKYNKGLPTFQKQYLADYWEKIEEMIEKTRTGNLYGGSRNFAYRHRKIAPDFFPAIIPFFQAEGQRRAFASLEYCNPEKFRTYLLDELKEPLSDPYASGILSALSKIDRPFDDIFEGVTSYYYREGNKTEGALAYLARILKKYPNKISKSIGLDILKRNKSSSALSAATLLVKTFKADKEVIDIIMPHFLEADSNTSAAAFVIFRDVGLINYLPEPKKILEIYTKISEKRQDSNITHCMHTIAETTGVMKLYEEIYTLLDCGKASVKEGILILLNVIINKKEYAIYRTPRFMDKYLALILEEDTGVIRNAMKLVSEVERYNKESKFVDTLIDIFNKHKDDIQVRLDAMQCINEMLAYIPYQPQIEPIYLKALEERAIDYIIRGLHGLSYSPNLELKRSLSIKFEKHRINAVKSFAASLVK